MAGYKVLIYSRDKVTATALAESLQDLPDMAEVVSESKADYVLFLAKQGDFDAFVIDNDTANLYYKLASLLPNTKTVLLLQAETERLLTNIDNGYVLRKPFKLQDFTNFICQRLLASIQQEEQALSIGDFIFYPLQRAIEDRATANKIDLTEKESYILAYLYKNKDKVVDKQELLEQVWGYNSDTATHTLETHIYRLRQKLALLGQECISSCDGGYQLV